MKGPPKGRGSSRAQQFSTAQMVKALDRHPEARRPYWRLYARAVRADEPGIHGRSGARISFGRRELHSGAADLRHEAASHDRSRSLAVNFREDRGVTQLRQGWAKCAAPYLHPRPCGTPFSSLQSEPGPTPSIKIEFVTPPKPPED